MVKERRKRRTKSEHPEFRGADVSVQLTLEILRGLGGSVSQLCALALMLDDQQPYLDIEVEPSDYENSADFKRDYLAVSVLSKSPTLKLPNVQREAVALERFKEGEERCRITNERLSHVKQGPEHLFAPCDLEFWIPKIRRRIARVLGPFDLSLFEGLCDFGPGATRSIPRRWGDAFYKFREKPETTTQNAILSMALILRIPAWFRQVCHLAGLDPEEARLRPVHELAGLLLDVAEGNRVQTVPKSAKTDRTIAIEPTMNGFVQTGIGKMIRKRIGRLGLLRPPKGETDAQVRNQSFAKIGSVDGSLATIDLSMASDTVAYGLVDALLPEDWAMMIKLSRSPVGTLPSGEKVTYQKVSSMGNGFTFELETLLFWAIARSVCRSEDRRLAVFGDDIVVPTEHALEVMQVLRLFGFEPNVEKTFWTGPFRESCGKHYFNGDDVTPFYIREAVDTTERLFWLGNQIRRWSRLYWGLDGALRPAYEKVVSLVPEALQKPSIPDGIGDMAFIGDFDEVCPVPCRGKYRTWEGWEARFWVRSAKLRRVGGDSYLLRTLMHGPTGGIETVNFSADWFNSRSAATKLWLREGMVVLSSCMGRIPVLGSYDRWELARLPTALWPSFGPWLG